MVQMAYFFKEIIWLASKKCLVMLTLKEKIGLAELIFLSVFLFHGQKKAQGGEEQQGGRAVLRCYGSFWKMEGG